jgi:hypothetical protein
LHWLLTGEGEPFLDSLPVVESERTNQQEQEVATYLTKKLGRHAALGLAKAIRR